MHIDVITDNIKSISSENVIKGVNELSRTLNISYKINNDEWETFNFEYAYVFKRKSLHREFGAYELW